MNREDDFTPDENQPEYVDVNQPAYEDGLREETQIWDAAAMENGMAGYSDAYVDDGQGYDPAYGAAYPQGDDAQESAYMPDGAYADAGMAGADGQAEWPQDWTGTYTADAGDGSWLGEEASIEEEKPPRRTILKPRARKPSFFLAVAVHSFQMLVLLVLLLGLSGLGAVVGVAKAYMETAPTLDLAAIDDQAQTSFIYDANGNQITDYKGSENRIMVSIDTMPLMLQHAFVAVEDARFYTHNGVDIKRIVGAFVTNFVSGSQQGGSTITQQLIKNTLLSSEQSYKRKIQEAYLAMQLETRYTKNEILESYLNTIYLGEDYYGVKVAAYGFFGKDNLNDLTLRECAMLAGMTNNPYYYNPRRNFYTRQSDTTDYKKITNDRTDYVLRCMYENQFITRDQYLSALETTAATVLEKSPASTELYPYAHYVEYAIRDVVKTLLSIRGLEDTSANRNKMENELRTGGYHVFLALDTHIQTIVENTLQTYKDYPALRDPSDKVYRARNSDGTYDEIIQPQAAAVVLDYRTGEVKAIVGGRTAPTKRKTLNRAADMNMPVGSSIKPIAVYAPAIEMGAGAGTILYNIPVPVHGWVGADGKDTWPKNYGGSSYRGPETLRTAITRSDNTAAAYALMNFVGVDRSADFLLRLGVSENHINKTPFGLALGSSGISPFEMAVAFGVLGNGGVYQSPVTFMGIFDSNQQPIYVAHSNQVRRQVFKASTAWLTVDMMKDVVSSGTGTAAKLSGQTVAGKTGTNSDQKGVFFVGMTGWYVGAVWIGHDNYKALSSKTTGGNSAAKLWKAFMQPIHQNLGNRDIMEGSASDYGLVKVTTCKVSGQLATDACKHDVMGYGTTTDYWPKDSAPTVSCQMHYALNVCADSGLLAGPYCPSTETKGVVILPMGHPLYDLIGTSYEGVLADYLGEYATLRLTADGNANAAILSAHACNIHSTNAINSSIDDTLLNNYLLPDAQRLLSQAQNQLAAIDPSHPGYANLASAISALSSVLNGSPDSNTLAAAMSRLTTAMAGAQ
ncbi:MAG: transglycosylase domain-containing protein [Clostridia bacterium]|nr:transglycosylase domain-containing protein [Clostridia bacterium]